MKTGFHAAVAALTLAVVAGCAQTPPRVDITDRGPNAVALWAELGAAVTTTPPAPSGTPEERRPVYSHDMATLHLAIHEAVRTAAPASQEAAAHAAGRAVLAALFPQRAASYQSRYDQAVASLPPGDARDEGLRLGVARAARVIAARADDGRWDDVPPAQPGTAPGAFRGVNPINQTLPRIRPFLLERIDQFRSPPPPGLDSDVWIRDLAETRDRGADGAVVTPREDEGARFHTEPPSRFWTRNLGRFARSQATLADNARLMALLWTTHADASAACFDAKYAHYRWRPFSVLGTPESPGKPRVSTPNHPEYPAAHSCASGALAQALTDFFGTGQVAFRIDSTVTGSWHDFTDVDALLADVRDARIVGGMHFRHSLLAGEVLGREVARWATTHLFAMAHVPDLEGNEVAAAQLAVDAQVEERQLSYTRLHLQSDAESPDACGLTLRWSRLASAWHLARFPEWSIIRPAGQAPHRYSRLSSNVRRHEPSSIANHSASRGNGHGMEFGPRDGPSAGQPRGDVAHFHRSQGVWPTKGNSREHQ